MDKEVLLNQILAVRDSGKVNMLDYKGVQYVANKCGFHELVIFIEEAKKKYVRFVFTGDENCLELD